jgi:hypothetical protein
MLSISRLTSVFHSRPSRETMNWLDFAGLLSEPQRSPCTRKTCPRQSCPHKRGPCWSPATFPEYRQRVNENVEAISLLVFDVDQLTDDQFDEIRSRLGAKQYLVHSTHSDQPDRRCLRFVFPLSRSVLPDAWSLFWRATQRSLVPKADPASADAGRIYFLPSCPHDASYFIQVNAGSPLDVDAVLASLGAPSSTCSTADGIAP